MGRIRAMSKTLKKFKVKASRKQLEKSKKMNKQRRKEAMETADENDIQKNLHIVEKEKRKVNEKMETEQGEVKSGSTTRKNDGRLRKGEMPFVVGAKGRKDSGSSSKNNHNITSTINQQQGVTSKRQITKKKARKVMRNLKREERRKERMVNAMETDEK